MKAIRVVSCALFLVLADCGHRQTAQQANQTAAQQGTEQASVPASSQPVSGPANDPAQPGTQPGGVQAAQPATAQTPIGAPPIEAPPMTGTPAPEANPQAARGGAQAYPQAPNYQQAPAYPQAPDYAMVIPAGSVFRVRLDETLDTKHNRAGDRFYASLMRPVMADGVVMVPRGTRCSGHLVESKPSGRFRGRAVMSLRLDTFELNGRIYAIRTGMLGRESRGHKRRNWAFLGGGAGFGTVVGAIGGGAVGALIGAGAGGAAGAAGEAITGRKNVRLPVETPLAFSLRDPVRVRG